MGRPRGLAETRTSISTHGRSTPPGNRQGQGFLDSYVLSLELKRLESTLAHLERQRVRVEVKLRNTRRAAAIAASKRGEVSPSGGPPTRIDLGDTPPVNERELPGQIMTIHY
jgi:hypothetical protein